MLQMSLLIALYCTALHHAVIIDRVFPHNQPISIRLDHAIATMICLIARHQEDMQMLYDDVLH